MKKLVTVLLTVLLVLGLAACNKQQPTPEPEVDIHAKGEGVMTYADYSAAAEETEVTVEFFVQGKQSFWENSVTIYGQDKDGGYFVYGMPCTQEEYDKLTVGTKLKVKGYKTSWAGEVEIIDATFEIEEGNWVAEATDVTSLLGTDGLLAHKDKLVSFKGMKVEASIDADGNEKPFLYKWNGTGTQGDDIYFNVSVNGQTYQFTVETNLCDSTTDVYKAAEALSIGDTVNLEGFLYWYEGPNPHITKISK